jgi:hypothetical protein
MATVFEKNRWPMLLKNEEALALNTGGAHTEVPCEVPRLASGMDL